MTTFDAASNARGNTTASWSHTVGAGSNRLLLVFAGGTNAQTFSTVTYGGVSLTFVGRALDAGGGVCMELWKLVAPASGTGTVVATPAAGNTTQCVAISFSNVDQTTPLGTLGTSVPGAGTTSISKAITDSAAADLVAAAVNVSDSSVTVTPGAGQTDQGNPGHSFPGNQTDATTQVGSSGTVTPSFTLSGSQRIVLAAVAVKDGSPAAGAWRPPAIQTHSRAVSRATVI